MGFFNKFYVLLIFDFVFHFYRSAQRNDTFLLPLRGRQKKKTIATRYFWALNNLCDLCGSNERSEWAVNYRIKLNPTAVNYGLK